MSETKRWPIELLRRQYVQLVEPEHLILPQKDVIKLPEVQAELFETMFRKGSLEYPPSERYQLRVLKRIVTALEEAIDDPDQDEISDDLTTSLARLMASKHASESTAAHSQSYVTYHIPSIDLIAPSITTLETRALLAASGTTGFRTWEASLFLSTFLSTAQGRDLLRDRNVLELGAGTGLVSLLCAKHLGARFVLATDGADEVVDQFAMNIRLSGLEASGRLRRAGMQWGSDLPSDLDDLSERKSFDIVVGADIVGHHQPTSNSLQLVVAPRLPDLDPWSDIIEEEPILTMIKTYDERALPALMATFQGLFDLNAECKILLAATIRNEKTWQAYLTACQEKFWLDHIEVETREQTGLFYSSTVPLAMILITASSKNIPRFS